MRMSARECGSALLVALAMVVIALGLAAALLAAVMAEMQVSAHARDRAQALYIAEAGVNHSLTEIGSALDIAGDGLGTIDGSFGGGQYSVIAVPSGTAYILHSTGTLREEQRKVEAIVEPVEAVLFQRAALGTEHTYVGSNPTIDSYDSTLGSYASQAVNSYEGRTYALASGHVQSNASARFGWDLWSTPFVFGDFRPGPGCSVEWIATQGHVSGSTAPQAEIVTPIEIVPPAVPLGGAVFLGGSSAATIGPGDVGVASVVIQDTAAVTIVGPARVVIAGDAWLLGRARVNVDAAGGPVEIFVGGQFWSDSGTKIDNPTQRPGDLTIFITGTSAATHRSSSPLYGCFYATRAGVVLYNAEVMGAVVGKAVHFPGNSRLHYDLDLGRRTKRIPGRYRVTLWREVTLGPMSEPSSAASAMAALSSGASVFGSPS